MARTATIAPEAVQAVSTDEFVNIAAGDRFLLVVTDADARLEGIDRRLLARTYVDRIQGGLRAYRHAREPKVLLRGAQRAILATVLLLAALLGLRWAFRRLEPRIGRRYEERIHSVQIQSFEILRAQRLRDAFRAVLRLLRALSAAVLFYFWLHFVLGSFPVTRPLATRLLSLVLEPLSRLGGGLLVLLPDLAFLLVLYLVTRWIAAAWSGSSSTGWPRARCTLANFEPEWALPTYRIVRLLDRRLRRRRRLPLHPGLELGGLQGRVALPRRHLLARLVLVHLEHHRRLPHDVPPRLPPRRPDPGRRRLGDVTEIRLQVTHLRSPKNEEIVVPNSTILNSNVINYSALARKQGLILHTTVGIGYETPWRQVEAMLLLAAERTPGLLREPAPFVLAEVARRLLRRPTRSMSTATPRPRWRACTRDLHQQHPRRLQRVRRPDHDAGLRGRPRAAEGRAEGQVVERRPRSPSAPAAPGQPEGGSSK